MKKNEPDKLLTIAEVSQMIALSETTIYAGRCRTSELARIELRDDNSNKATVRFSYNDVQAWIEKHKQVALQKRAVTEARKHPYPKSNYYRN